MVRTGENLKSPETKERLQTGTLLWQRERRGERLRFEKLLGPGPTCGWISVTAKGKPLVENLGPTDGSAVEPLPAEGVPKAPAEALAAGGEIWVVCVGSRGDSQPYLALAVGLQEAGWKVKIFMSEELVTLAQRLGLDAVGCTPDFEFAEQIAQESYEKFYTLHPEEKTAEGDLRESSIDFAVNDSKCFNASFQDMIPKMLEMCAKRKPDLVINFITTLAPALALFVKHGVPFVPMDPFMPTIPMSPAEKGTGEEEDAYYTYCDCSSDRILERLLGEGVTPLADMTVHGWRRYRRSMRGLKVVPHVSLRLFDESNPDIVNFASYPARSEGFVGPLVLPEEAQTKPEIRQGCSAFGEDGDWQAVQDFLGRLSADGRQPVYVGFGSIPLPIHAALATFKILRALKETGNAAIVYRGAAGLSLEELQNALQFLQQDSYGLLEYARENVLFVASGLPHEWLFKRCACIVHHCGSGTTSAALRAGVPAIGLPIRGDQPEWSALIERLGVGKGFEHTGDVLDSNVEMGTELADALRLCTESEEMKARAREIGEAVRDEPGVAGAVAYINKIWKAEINSGTSEMQWKAYMRKVKLKQKNPDGARHEIIPSFCF